ncbi:MAG: gliding motility-associated C-terminal domain-containing protein [Bacteroidota bacterium]
MRRSLLAVLLVLCLSPLSAQFNLVGDASLIGLGCFQLTPNNNNQLGAVWTSVPIDFSQGFDLVLEFNLGCNNNGADGMAFVFQQQGPTALGNIGAGLGYEGITPSIGIELDNFQTGPAFDPADDHIAIGINGNVNHASPQNLAGPTQILNGVADLEDCQFHDLRVQWDPFTDSLKVYVDCEFRLGVEYDFINLVFGGNPLVFWGATAATGGATNAHQFCLKDFATLYDTVNMCLGDTIPLDAGTGVPTDTYEWTTNYNLDGPTNQIADVYPVVDTTYQVIIRDSCGIPTVYYFLVDVTDPATLNVDLGDDFSLCPGEDSLLDGTSPEVAYLWQDNSNNPTFLATTPGLYWLEYSNVCGTQRDSLTIDPIFAPVVNLGPDDAVCEGDTVSLDVPIPNATFVWQDNSIDSTFDVTLGGQYFVEVTNQCGIGRDTVNIVVADSNALDIDLGADFQLCAGSDTTIDVFRPGVTYTWQDGSSDSAFTISSGGIYWVELTNACGSQRDSVIVQTVTPPVVDLGPNDTICGPGPVLLDVPVADATFEWQDGSADSTFLVTTSGLYFVAVTNGCGTTRDTVTITFGEAPSVELGNDTTICDGSGYLLTATSFAATYTWQDNSANPTFLVIESGEYFVEVSNVCGTVNDTVNILYDQRPDIDLGPDTTFCEGGFLVLDATWTPTSTYVWQDGDSAATKTITVSNIYEVIVTNGCGLDRDTKTVTVEEAPLGPFFEDSTLLCDGLSVTLTTPFGEFEHLWQDFSTDTQFVATQEGTYFVTVTNDCGSATDTTLVRTGVSPTVDFGDDVTACEGDPVFADITFPGATYAWQDGYALPTRDITESGLYSVIVTNECGATEDAYTVTFVEAPTGLDLGDDRSVCEGDTLELDATQATFPPVVYRWQDGTTEPTYPAFQTGYYAVVISNECGETQSDVNLEFVPAPFASIRGDSILCIDGAELITLDAGLSFDAEYRWQNGVSTPTVDVEEPGLYTVNIENVCGSDSDSLLVVARSCNCEIYVPTAFTPNGDIANDAFFALPATSCQIVDGSLAVFNRLGQKVFETVSPEDRWDGTDPNGRICREGVYVWRYNFTLQSGGLQVNVQQAGTVTLVK